MRSRSSASLRVRQTRTFDEVGHPIRGGLYDPAFGPLESRDRCETCNQYEIYCPGHFGHIRLDVPVFNPMLFAFCFNILAELDKVISDHTGRPLSSLRVDSPSKNSVDLRRAIVKKLSQRTLSTFSSLPALKNSL
ncbi:hypothetical protein KIN20_025203 [Parelaphostrongylus tenuis]|uniref:DNA-directed RNA polymerase n=1 Tax=Parelaphostrongylus tenuis TaxID=148309 RepID=A0AAD5NBQ0_PARTN|nr:hypothetical protein KIN20_025203 [Parelaphostrongylus tenuis]